MNHGSVLQVQLTGVGANSALAQIVGLVEQAQSQRAPVQESLGADGFSRGACCSSMVDRARPSLGAGEQVTNNRQNNTQQELDWSTFYKIHRGYPSE